MQRFLLPGLLPLLLLPACQGTDSGPVPIPAGLEVVAGGDQPGTVGLALDAAILARVTDAGGNPVSGVPVTFLAAAGDGVLTPETAETDATGEASAAWTLGPGAGAQSASVTVEGVTPVAVSATAAPGPAARLQFESSPHEAIARDLLVPPVVVAVHDEFGNLVATSSAEIHLNLNQGALGGEVTRAAVSGRAIFSDLHIDLPGTQYVLTATADGLAATESAAFQVARGTPVITTIQVSPSEPSLLVDQTASLTATVLDELGDPIDGASVSWETDDATVATVSEAGLVTAQGVGTATITAASAGVTGTAQVSVSFGEGSLSSVTYCTIGGVQDKMDVFIPSASFPRPLPVAVHVHGGGWVSGERSTGTRFNELKTILLARGYVVASLDYRLAPAHKYPAQIQDVKCAVRHLRSRAVRYGVDPDRIGAWGGSAGGQLVALLGTADAAVGFDDVGGFPGVSSAVQAVIAYSAITDFSHPDELLDDYSRVFDTWPDPDSPEMIEASPITHITGDDPPFFLIVGDEDDLVLPAQSVRMDARLLDAGVTSSLLRVLHADHDLEPTDAPTDPSQAQIVSRMADFFDRQLR